MSDDQGRARISPVAGTAKPLVSKKVATIALGLAVTGVLGVVYWRSANPPDEPVKEKLPTTLAVTTPYTPPQMVVPRQAPPLAPVSFVAPPLVHYEPPLPAILPATTPAAPPAAPAVHLAGVGAMTAPAFLKPNSLTFAAPTPLSPVEGKGGDQAGSASVSRVTYAPSHVDGVQAGLLGDQTFLMTGGILPCTLTTAVNSTFPGPIECEVSADIKPHGVTLIDRGSIIHGTYTSAANGQARLFVQAEWLHDPVSGCYVTFQNDPITDTLGTAGVPGSVDNQYLQRFGAAMLLTLGQGGESILQSAVSKQGSTSLNFSSGGGGLDQIANAILRKQIDLPPIITLNQGSTIAVFLSKTKVLDFSTCYDLKVKDR